MQIWKSLPICLCSYKDDTLKKFASLILEVFALYTLKFGKCFVYKHTDAIEYVKN